MALKYIHLKMTFGYLNVKHVIPCANGTDALQISLMSLGLKLETKSLHLHLHIATTEVIALLRLKPVFVDVQKDTFVLTLKNRKSNNT